MTCKNCKKETQNTDTCNHCGHCPKCGQLTYSPIHECVKRGNRLILSVICLTLSVLACGMPVNTQPTAEMNTNVSYPSITPAPVPKMVLQEKQTVCNLWNVREYANPKSRSLGIVIHGGIVTLTGRQISLETGGEWVEVIGVDSRGRKITGWMNKKGLCEVKK